MIQAFAPTPASTARSGPWDVLLAVGFVLVLAGGILFLAAPDAPVIAWLNRGVARAFYGGAAEPVGAASLRRWLYAVEGSTLVALGVLGLAVARTAFRRRERWARNALAVSVGLWFPLDTAVSLAHGVVENALLNVAIALMLLLPVAATWRSFPPKPGAPSGGRPRRGASTTGAVVPVLLLPALAGALLAAAPARAQAPPPADPDGASRWSVSGHWSFRWTRLYEDAARVVGGGLMLAPGPRTRVGLAGFGTASPSTYSTLDFRIGYGGLRVEHDLWRSGRWTFAPALLAGGGVFQVEDRATGADPSTGVVVVEPELLLGAGLGDHLRVSAAGGWRWVAGVEGEIENRSDGDARGWVVGVQLTVR